MFAAGSARRACSLGGRGCVLLGGSLEGVGFGAGCSCDLSLGLVGETCCWRMVTGGSSLACFLGDSTPFPGGTLEVPCGDAPDRCRPLLPEVPGMLEECHEGVLGRAGCAVDGGMSTCSFGEACKPHSW